MSYDPRLADAEKANAMLRQACNDRDDKIAELRDALGALVDAVNVEFPGGMNIGGKTGPALIQAVNALATKPNIAAILDAQKNNHAKPLQLD